MNTQGAHVAVTTSVDKLVEIADAMRQATDIYETRTRAFIRALKEAIASDDARDAHKLPTLREQMEEARGLMHRASHALKLATHGDA